MTIIKVDQGGGGIMDYSIRLYKLKKNLFKISTKIKKENNKEVLIYQLGNSSRKILLDFFINKNNKKILEIHDLLARNIILRKMYPFLLPWFLRKTDSIILHSNHAKKRFEKIYGKRYNKKIKIIPLLVFKPNTLYKREKRKGKIYYLLIGQIKKSKGLFEILDSFSNLTKKEAEKSKLIIAGKINKKLLKDIKDIPIKNLTTINKYLSEKEFNQLIVDSDYIFNFKIEELGESSGNISRAIYFKKPVIASKIGTNIEFLSKSRLLVPLRKEALKNKIKETIKNHKKIKKYETSLMDALKKEISDERIIKNYEAIISEINNEK